MKFLSVLVAMSLTLGLTGCVSSEERFSEAVTKVTQSIESDDLELAQAQLADALRILPDSSEGKQLQVKLDDLSNSKASFQAAEKAISASNFSIAIEQLEKVSSKDTLRSKEAEQLVVEVTADWNQTLLAQLAEGSEGASQKLGAVENASRQVVITEELWAAYESRVVSVAASFRKAKDYLAQYQFLIARNPEGLPGTSLVELKAKALKSYEASVKTKVSKLFAQQDLKNAQKAISAAIQVQPASQVFKNLQVQLDGKVESSVKTKVLKLFGMGDLSNAQKAITAAQKSRPDSKVFKNLQLQLDKKVKAAEERARKASLKAMFVKSDSFEGINWYYDRATYNRYASNKFMLYMGKRKSGSPWLRFQAVYYDDDWVFFDEIKVNVDGEIYYLSADYFDIERDNSGGSVWEWLDISPGSYELEMIEAIIGSRSTTIRFIGDQYHADRTISSAQKRAFRNVLNAYEVLGG